MNILLKTELNAALARIPALADEHPLVRRIAPNTYQVDSRRSGKRYTVRLTLHEGAVHTDCDCPAGQRGFTCYHIAACCIVQAGINRRSR